MVVLVPSTSSDDVLALACGGGMGVVVGWPQNRHFCFVFNFY